eukprot:3903054-Karenia_brevis.AAC.1
MGPAGGGGTQFSLSTGYPTAISISPKLIGPSGPSSHSSGYKLAMQSISLSVMLLLGVGCCWGACQGEGGGGGQFVKTGPWVQT